MVRLGSENYSGPIVAKGRVYVGTNDEKTGGLVWRLAMIRDLPVFLHDPATWLAVHKLGSPVWSIPCAANKTLFVSSQRNLWAVEEQGEMP